MRGDLVVRGLEVGVGLYETEVELVYLGIVLDGFLNYWRNG